MNRHIYSNADMTSPESLTSLFVVYKRLTSSESSHILLLKICFTKSVGPINSFLGVGTFMHDLMP